MKNNKKLTLSLVFISMLFVFGMSESFAQEVTLEANRRENTYKTWNVNGVLDIQVRDAKSRGKLLEGRHRLKYKCKKDSNTEFLRDIELTNGNSARLQNICAKLIAEIINIGDKTIRLRKGAGTNGFIVVRDGNSAYLKTNNVIDPNTNNPLEGSQKISVSFYPDYEPSLLFAVHRGGNSRSKRLRKLLSALETDDGDDDDFYFESSIEELDEFRQSGETLQDNNFESSIEELDEWVRQSGETLQDNDSGGRDNADSTKNSPTKSKTKNSTNKDNRSSTTSDDVTEVTPIRADSSVAQQNKSGSSAKSSNENENTAVNGRETKAVKLVKDARKNGYKTWKEDGVYFFQANNVIDPITKELVNGLHDISYRCGSGNELTRIIKLNLSRGNTQRVAIACALIKEPKILLLDEPYPN